MRAAPQSASNFCLSILANTERNQKITKPQLQFDRIFVDVLCFRYRRSFFLAFEVKFFSAIPLTVLLSSVKNQDIRSNYNHTNGSQYTLYSAS